MTSASLSDAAKKLGRTQPAVSAAIKALEDQLGLQLFERRGRKLIPVPEAHYLLAEADTILAQVSRVRQTMRSL
ncbi:MAG: LysR family transcriptional regulator, partial [Litoreibacter sp.]|nr:LysR family transcriptional regulator [Litoreibacter sp.]